MEHWHEMGWANLRESISFKRRRWNPPPLTILVFHEIFLVGFIKSTDFLSFTFIVLHMYWPKNGPPPALREAVTRLLSTEILENVFDKMRNMLISENFMISHAKRLRRVLQNKLNMLFYGRNGIYPPKTYETVSSIF